MKYFNLNWLLLFIIFTTPASSKSTYQIDHLEPPFWWTGMVDNTLQLMVHGKNIADLEPELSYPGVEINQVHRLDNPNYLFIDLLLSEATIPGKFDIVFKQSGQRQINYTYELLIRNPNSAERQGFTSADVIYLITPDRYANGDPSNDSSPKLKEKSNRRNKDGRHGGDIQGIIDHLDYISEMGFTQIWLNPVLQNDHPSYSYHGYSTTDYYQIDGRFGSNALYKKLSEQAKQKRIGIIKDIILNHIGSEHWWMRDLPTSDWIHNNGEYIQTSHNHESVHDPYLTQSEKDSFTDGWFVRTMPDLNQTNPYLAMYLIQNSIWWIEYASLSGFRVDTYPYVDKIFLSEWSRRITKEYPDFSFVGEEWSSNQSMIAYWQKDSPRHDNYKSYAPNMMDFPLQEALVNSLLSKETWETGIKDLYKVLANDYLYGNPYNLVVFAGNHDMTRIYSQLKNDFDLYKMAMKYILTTRGIPQVYYGTEILMTGPSDHGSLRADFPGGWSTDKINAFDGQGLKPQQKSAQGFIKKLLNWRKESFPITKGEFIHFHPSDGVYVYFRKYEDELVMVLMNNNNKTKNISTDRFFELLADKKQGRSIVGNKVYDLTTKINLPAKSALILEIN
ncbi:MAG: glycoside hydrolase family 13 protein [Candidatus Marinimicrobia bacterium]|nr:glycoside hydrolase family 13 protein [Candidatus Neomarinimicrobiota bacterium]